MEPTPMLHRDIKPGNILLTANRKRVKLADFGISKILANDKDGNRGIPAQKMTNNLGTGRYMAPEVGEKPTRVFDTNMYV
jgi:serine/threonine protein kinase